MAQRAAGHRLRPVLLPALELRADADRQPGTLTVMARATNRAGATQTFELIHNPAGYHHNVVQRVALTVAPEETDEDRDRPLPTIALVAGRRIVAAASTASS